MTKLQRESVPQVCGCHNREDAAYNVAPLGTSNFHCGQVYDQHGFIHPTKATWSVEVLVKCLTCDWTWKRRTYEAPSLIQYSFERCT